MIKETASMTRWHYPIFLALILLLAAIGISLLITLHQSTPSNTVAEFETTSQQTTSSSEPY